MENEVIKTGENFEIDGVVITPDVIGELEFLQRDENNNIMQSQQTIANAICRLLTSADGSGHDYLNIKRDVIDLAHMHGFFSRLKSSKQTNNQ